MRLQKKPGILIKKNLNKYQTSHQYIHRQWARKTLVGVSLCSAQIHTYLADWEGGVGQPQLCEQ